MITKNQKKEIITQLQEKLAKHKIIVFSDYTGIKANQIRSLRKKLKAQNIDYQIAKKTLIDLALEKAKTEKISTKTLQGQISVTIGYDDEVLPAKILADFAKENEAFKILSGLINNQQATALQIKTLANLPSQSVLLSQLVGSIASPMTGLLNALSGNLRSLVYILKNIKPGIEAKA